MIALKDDNKPNNQKVAICESTYTDHMKSKYNSNYVTRHVVLEGKISTVAKGQTLLITGALLRPGRWVGLDRIPTNYSEDFINNIYQTLPGNPIRFAHRTSPVSMDPSIPPGTTVGFWTRSKANQALLGRGYVFDPRAIKYLQEHPNTKLSLEAKISSLRNPDGSEEAIDGYATGGALIDDPACKTAEPVAIRTVTLERGKQSMEHIKYNEQGDNTQETYLKFVESELTALKVPEEEVKKTIETIAKIEKPFEIKAPEVTPPEITPPEPLPAEVAELVAYQKASKKPFPEAIKEFVKEKFNAAGNSNPTDDAKVLELKTELEATRTILNQRMTEDIGNITEQIKTYDTDFKSEKLLENVKDLPTQKKLLEVYLGSLKKHARPIQLQLSPEDATTKVGAVAESMFGSSKVTPEEILGLGTKK